MKKHKNKIIIGIILILLLAFTFWYGGNSTSLHGIQVLDKEDSVTVEKSEKEPSAEKNDDTNNPGKEAAEKKPEEKSESETVIDEKAEKDQYQTDPVPEGNPMPVEPQDSKPKETQLTCTLSVRCDTILKNISQLNPEKKELIPSDGIIFPEQEVIFYEGESVFNLLLREMKRNKIHMEFENTPIYNSAYIEGIANIYEFDCGELSGWMYKVNGWFPNYGCSRYLLHNGDKIEWIYTCELGEDIGGHYKNQVGDKDE